MKSPKPGYGVNYTVRLPKDLAAFVEELADQSCNTAAGIIRLALTRLKQSTEQPLDSRDPELVGCP